MKQCVSCIDRFFVFLTRSFSSHGSRVSLPLSLSSLFLFYFMPCIAHLSFLHFLAGCFRYYRRRRSVSTAGSGCFFLLFVCLLLSSKFFFLREHTIVTVSSVAAGATGQPSAAKPPGSDLPFLFKTPPPTSPTLYQEGEPLPFLREKTLFLIANEPVLESHVASNLLHQLLYTLQIPNGHVWLLDELLLQGPQNAKFAAFLPWLVHTYYNLPDEIEYIWIGTSYSRVVGRALEKLLRTLHGGAGTARQQQRDGKEKRQEQLENAAQHDDEVSPQGLCIGFGLRDATPSIRHHYFSEPDFIYPFLSAGLLIDRHFLHFLVRSVHATASTTASTAASHERTQKVKQHVDGAESRGAQREEEEAVVLLPARIEIDTLHEFFKYLYDKHKMLLTHSDLFCPDNPMPRTLDRTEAPYPAPHRRQRRPSPAKTLLDIIGRSSTGSRSGSNNRSSSRGSEKNAAKKVVNGSDDDDGERTEKKDVAGGGGSGKTTSALRKAEEDITSCVSFAVGSRHSPILSHQFFDRLMEYEEDKIVRKDKATEKYPLDSLLSPDSAYARVEDEILNERPLFIVEPEDVLIALKTHDQNLKTRVPLQKNIWASAEVITEMAKRRIQQSQPAVRHPFGDATAAAAAQEELHALEDNMEQLRIIYFADSPLQREKDGKGEGKNTETSTEETTEKSREEKHGIEGGETSTAGETTETEETAANAADTAKLVKKAAGETEAEEEGRNKEKKRKKHIQKPEEEGRRSSSNKEENSDTNVVRVPVSYANQKRSLCEKVKHILKYFYYKEKKRRFLVIGDDDTLMNVRHLLDLISLSLQPPIPARAFFRQALTSENSIRQAHEPYKQLAAAIDDFMLPWRREFAVLPAESSAATTNSFAAAAATAEKEKDAASPQAAAAASLSQEDASGGETKRRRSYNGEKESEKKNKKDISEEQHKQQQQRRVSSSAVAASYVAAAYTKAWRKLPSSSADAAADAVPTRAAAADAISPLYIGERYSFGHTAASSPRPWQQQQQQRKRTRSSKSDDEKEEEYSRREGMSEKTTKDGSFVRGDLEGEEECSRSGTCGSSAVKKSNNGDGGGSSVLSYPLLSSSFSRVNALFSTRGYDYITGGGGIVLDRAAVRLLLFECPYCACPPDGTADDMLLGLWLQQVLHIPAVHAPAFHQERPQEYHAAHLRQITPLSFHRFHVDGENASKRNFQKYLDIGEGMNIGKYEEDDYQSLDWIDHDWQQVEDLLWHEAEDISDFSHRRGEEEEEEEEEDEEREGDEEEEGERRVGGDEDVEKEAAKRGEQRKGVERETVEGAVNREGYGDTGDETRRERRKKRRQMKKKKKGDEEKQERLDFPYLIQQILNDAAITKGRVNISNEEAAQRLQKRAAEIDKEIEEQETRRKQREMQENEAARRRHQATHDEL